MAGSSARGFNPHLPGLGHQLLSKAIGATMWFFIFYRARQDGSKFLYGLGPQLLAHDEHHDSPKSHH